MKQYDVFISYSRRDYLDEKENVLPESELKTIIDFFDANGISYWIDKEGHYKKSGFVEKISEAIADSKMMVFVSSVHSNASFYTTGEILEAIDRKMLIIPVRIDNSPYSKKFKLLLNPLDYIDYSKADALHELLKAVNAEKESIARHEAEMERKREAEERRKREELENLKEAERRKREQEELAAKRSAVLAEVKDKIAEVGNHRISQKNLKAKVCTLLRSIDIKEKKCPVCGSSCSIEEDFCPVCGWHFSSFSGIAEIDMPASFEENTALAHYSAAWEKSKNASTDNKAVIDNLKAENVKLNDSKEKLNKENAQLLRDNKALKHEVEQLKAGADTNKIPKWLKITGLGCAGTVTLSFACMLFFFFVGVFLGDEELEPVSDTEETWVDADSDVAELPVADRTFTVKGVEFTMVYVEGGTFMMGSDDADAEDDEKPVHQVTLSDYYIGQTEVTQALWQAVMGSNISCFKGDNLPVESVSWYDCQDFIGKLNQITGENFCLPTEAQWEFAARGGVYSKGYKYSGSNDIDEVAWYNGNSDGKTHPVGKKMDNELGICDMSGNVYEWCSDCCDDYTTAAVTDPSGPSSAFSRSNRGGSWGNVAADCRCSYRFSNEPAHARNSLGLRLALK